MSNYKLLESDNNSIFVTVTTTDMKPILIDNISLLKTAIIKSKQNYNYDFVAGVILPDHFHMIIKPAPIEDASKIISNIKQYFTHNLDDSYKPADKVVWQKGYSGNKINSQNDLMKYLDYIHYDPVKHSCANKPRDWQYSSFKKFVMVNLYDENWTCADDINKIKDLDLG